MGSAARGEQLLMTDQDNAMIISDEWKDKKPIFLKLAEEIISNLHTIGYQHCPAAMMASNPEWCLTLQEFKEKVTPWVINPGPKEVMFTTIFFDFRFEYGNYEITQEFKDYILKLLRESKLYIRFLAAQAIKNPPPLSFFRSFIIEKNGEHKDLFDIKLRGIAPLMDSARVLALDIPYLDETSTLRRFEIAKEKDPANEVLFKEAQEAYLELLQIRVKVALESNNNGRYIDPNTLTKFDKMNLRKCFEPGRRLLDMIERNFKLAYF
jgi:CBS domain-containing protein